MSGRNSPGRRRRDSQQRTSTLEQPLLAGQGALDTISTDREPLRETRIDMDGVQPDDDGAVTLRPAEGEASFSRTREEPAREVAVDIDDGQPADGNQDSYLRRGVQRLGRVVRDTVRPGGYADRTSALIQPGPIASPTGIATGTDQVLRHGDASSDAVLEIGAAVDSLGAVAQMTSGISNLRDANRRLRNLEDGDSMGRSDAERDRYNARRDIAQSFFHHLATGVTALEKHGYLDNVLEFFKDYEINFLPSQMTSAAFNAVATGYHFKTAHETVNTLNKVRDLDDFAQGNNYLVAKDLPNPPNPDPSQMQRMDFVQYLNKKMIRKLLRNIGGGMVGTIGTFGAATGNPYAAAVAGLGGLVGGLEKLQSAVEKYADIGDANERKRKAEMFVEHWINKVGRGIQQIRIPDPNRRTDQDPELGETQGLARDDSMTQILAIANSFLPEDVVAQFDNMSQQEKEENRGQMVKIVMDALESV